MNQWVVGLAIDEEISFGAARIDGDREFVVSTPPEHHRVLFSPEEANEITNMRKELRVKLEELRNDIVFANILNKAEAVGVSSIGLIDRSKLRLTDIARKEWGLWGYEENEFGEKWVLDFSELFDGLLPKIITIPAHSLDGNLVHRAINIHNDATARCLLEYLHLPLKHEIKSLFCVVISEGVNGGLVTGRYPFTSELHPEVGHIWPRLHPKDCPFDKAYSGCPIHKDCFEGVASGARIRKSWGYNSGTKRGKPKSLQELGKDYPDTKDHPWHRIAYYIAQLCMDATLAISPGRIVIGGPVVFPALIPIVKIYFEYFNSGNICYPDGSRRDYLRYPAMLDDDFIQIAQIRRDEAIRGALELARLAANNTGRALGLPHIHPPAFPPPG